MRGLLLCQAAKIAQRNGLLFPLRQGVDCRTQCNSLDHALLRRIRAQHALQRQPVACLLLQRFQRCGSQFGFRNLLDAQPCVFGEL